MKKQSQPRDTRDARDTRREAKLAGGKLLGQAFRLPGHNILPLDYITQVKQENIIWKRGNSALFRMGKGTQSKTHPPEGDDAACSWSDEHYKMEANRYWLCDLELQARFIARARRGKSGAGALAFKAKNIFNELFELANGGNATAAKQLAEILRGAVIQLTELAKAKSDLIKPIARKSWKWPVMKSRHPLLSDEHERFLGSINLGYDLPFYFDRLSGWRFDGWSQIAVALLMYVWGARKEQRGEWDYMRYGELVDTLPDFRRGENAEKWWKAAEAALLSTYPNPETIPELTKLVRLTRRTPSVVRQKIVERIQQRFLNFAKP